LVLAGAASLLVGVVPVTALARPSITIKECAQATTLRATIDPKKPDAAKKTKEVARLMKICSQKAAEDRGVGNPSAPPKKAATVIHPPVQNQPVRPAPVRPNPSPVRPVRPMMRSAPPPANSQQQTQRKVNVMDLLNGLVGKRTPAPAPPAPARAPAPAAAPPPVARRPAPAAAAPAPAAPAPAAVTPVAFTQPAAPPTSTAEQRNVFGIQLGEAFNFPPCAPGLVNASNPRAFESTAKAKQRSGAASCAQTGPAVQTLAQRMADAEGKPIPKGVEFALVRLGADRCPDWLSGSCTLSVALKSGVALGVAFLTIEDAERDIVRSLGSKYNGRPNASEPTACDAAAASGAARRMGSDHVWKLADLSLSYWSVQGLNCGQGRVMVQTSSLSELFAQAMTGDDQPKM
jgi:hypothetical protein